VIGAVMLVHHGDAEPSTLAASLAELARAVGAELPDHWVGAATADTATIPPELAAIPCVCIPLYPVASTRSWRCGTAVRGTTIVWFSYMDSYAAAVAAAVTAAVDDAGDRTLVFVAEDLADRYANIHAREVNAAARKVAATLHAADWHLVYFAGEPAGRTPRARDWLAANAAGKRIVLVPLTFVVEGADTAAIDRELVPLAPGAVRVPAIGTRLAPTLAALARAGLDPNID
jgi:hypothetical protein